MNNLLFFAAASPGYGITLDVFDAAMWIMIWVVSFVD